MITLGTCSALSNWITVLGTLFYYPRYIFLCIAAAIAHCIVRHMVHAPATPYEVVLPGTYSVNEAIQVIDLVRAQRPTALA